jgi:hypothetical protein
LGKSGRLDEKGSRKRAGRPTNWAAFASPPRFLRVDSYFELALGSIAPLDDIIDEEIATFGVHHALAESAVCFAVVTDFAMVLDCLSLGPKRGFANRLIDERQDFRAGAGWEFGRQKGNFDLVLFAIGSTFPNRAASIATRAEDAKTINTVIARSSSTKVIGKRTNAATNGRISAKAASPTPTGRGAGRVGDSFGSFSAMDMTRIHEA